MIEKTGDVYSYGDIIVRPTIDQDVLAAGYLRLKREGLLDLLFYEGTPSLCSFLSVYLKENSVTFECLKRSLDADVELVGLGKLQPPWPMGGGLTKAEITLVFFREHQNRQTSVAGGCMMRDWIFDRTTLDCIFGCTPVENKAMIRFSRALGFTLSYVPNYTTWNGIMTGVIISSMSRTEWESLPTIGLSRPPRHSL